MIKILNLILYIMLIVIPTLYFMYLLKSEHLVFKTFVVIMAILSTVGILLKFNFKPYNHIFIMFILICQFFTMYIYLLFICVWLYRCSFRFVKRKPYRFGNIVATIVAISLTIVGFHAHYDKKEVSYTVTVPKTSTVNELKICLVSDLHLGSGNYMRQVKKLVKTVNNNNYDLVCVAGDVFDENTPKKLMNNSLKVFKNMKSTYGTYWVSGNHEYYGKHTDFSVFEKYDIHFLKNKALTINNTFNIVGFTDVESHNQYNIQDIIKDIDPSLPTITLDHNPKRFDEHTSFTDLQLSGHTHNGQVFPGNIILSHYYKNSYGLSHTKDHYLIVSAGYGSWGFPFRLGTNCEYNTIYLKMKN